MAYKFPKPNWIPQREKNQFLAEKDPLWEERDRLDEEVEELQRQLQGTTDENTKKQLQQEISIARAKREVAHSKGEMVLALETQIFFWEQYGTVEEKQRCKKEVEEWEDEVKKNEEHLKKLESEKRKQYEEKQSKKQSLKLLDEALKDGFVEVIIVVCIVLGQPGVGKTHLKYLLLDRRPPHLRSSTICAETPVRVEIRTISGTKIQNIRGQWKEVSDDDMLDIVAKMILLAEPQLHQKSEQSILTKVANLFTSQDQGAAGAKLPSLKHSHKRKEFKQEGAVPTISDSCQKAMKLIMDKIVQQISKLTRDGFSPESQGESHSQGGFSEQSIGEIILKSKWVYFTDSGGQPQYHELLPLFVRSISSALCVTRLTDKLDEIQGVEYYQAGKQVGATQPSQLSTKDTIQCLVSTIQSYSTQDQPPKIIMVGTHLDKLEEVSTKQPSCERESKMQSSANAESVEEKDRKLLDMLKPEFGDLLVFPSNDMTRLLFILNTLNPGEREKGIAQSLRHEIESSGAREVKIPIWWYIMELLLQELAKVLGRGVLSRAECLEMARLLGIRSDSFDAALEFFDKLNVIKYSPDVLPDVVFVESQIPLDKVSELVSHNFLLRQPKSIKGALPLEGKWRHFVDRGIVSKACLKSKRFSRHYVPGIFSVDDLCELLKKLLVFAPVPNPVSAYQEGSTFSMSDKEKETHFVMPAALESLLDTALAQYRESSSEIAPLLVRFPQGSRRAGVFCCFVVHLISHFGWNRILDDTQPLYRNCFKIHLPTDPPCSVTLIDSNSLIEVHVKLAAGAVPSECSALLNVIKNAILSGIDAACIALNYKQTKPEFTFHCPHTQPSSQTSSDDRSEELKPHTATLNDKKTFLTCDLARENSYPLQAGHLVWLGLTKASSTSDESANPDSAQKSHPNSSSSLSNVIQQPVTASASQNSASHLPSIVEMSSAVNEGVSDSFVATSSRPCDDNDHHSVAHTGLSSPSPGEQVASTVSSTVLHAGLSSEAATSLAGTALSTQGLSTLQYPPLSRSGKTTTAGLVSTGGEHLGCSNPPSSALHLPRIPEYLSVSSSGATEDVSDNSKPTSSNLTVIRWRNERGEVKKFKLKSSIIHKRRDIGNLVVPRQQLEVWAKEKDAKECCEAVLSHWLDHPPRHYPATWEGLYELLDDSELGQVASELKQAVDNAI